MDKTVISYRRIDHLKALALDWGFSNEDAKQFGKLSKTATWEALLETYGIPLESVDTVDTLALFCHFRQKIIWDGYSIRLLPKTLISAILLENKGSNPRSIYS